MSMPLKGALIVTSMSLKYKSFLLGRYEMNGCARFAPAGIANAWYV